MISNPSMLEPDSPDKDSRSTADGSEFSSQALLCPAKSWLFAGLIVIFFLALSFICCGRPKYETNDDVVMSMLASGIGFVDKPEEHLLFSHYLIGKGLVWLYSGWPAVAWYSVYLLLAQCLAMLAMLQIFLSRANKRTLFVILPILMLSVFLRSTQLMQFSTTAALVCTSGALYLFEALERKLSWSMWKPLTLSLVFFCAGAAIRFESCKAIIVLATMFLLARIFTRLDWPRLRIGLLFLALIALLASALEFQNAAYYTKTGWGEYYNLNLTRYRLTEFGRTNILTAKIVSAFKAVDWSPVDSYMLSHFYILDRNVFAAEKLKQLDESIPKVKKVNIQAIYSDLLSVLGNLTIMPLLLCLGLASLFIDKTSYSYRSRLLYLAGFSAATIALLVVMKLPMYIFAALAGFSSAAFCWVAAVKTDLAFFRAGVLRRTGLAVMLCLWLCLTVMAVSGYRTESDRVSNQSKTLKETFSGLDRQLLYVAFAQALPYALIRPFDNLGDYFAGLKLVGINFLGRTPPTLLRLKNFGINDLLGQIDDKSVRLISKGEFEEKIAEYVEQHYNKEASFSDICRVPGLDFDICKVSMLKKLSPKQDLDRRWLEYLARIAGFNPGTGGSIVIAQELGCNRTGADRDLVLFPSKNDVWNFVDMKPVLPKQAEQTPECPKCKIEPFGAATFESRGKLPTMSHSGVLQIHPCEFRKFFVEIAAPESMDSNRALLVEFNLPEHKSWKFLIPLQIDSCLHRYEFGLDTLGFSEQDLISDINVHPVYIRQLNERPNFTVRNLGFER